MLRKSLFFAVVASVCLPFFAYGADDGGYIWKALGLDFYSTIDEGNYMLIQSKVNIELMKQPTLGEFGADCPMIGLIADKKTSIDILNYGNLSKALSENGYSTIRMDTYQQLMLCLQGKYDELVRKKQKETKAEQTLSSIGLYTDGNTTNSDYDIVADIDRINSVLFSENLKYNGTVNVSSKTLKNSLFLGPIPLPEKQKNGGPLISVVKLKTGSNTSGTGGLSSVIGDLCTENTSGVALDAVMDRQFMTELDHLLKSPHSTTNLPSSNNSWSGNSSWSNTSVVLANDFFDSKPPCGWLFCIDVRFISWGNPGGLGGSKSISIESIIDKHSKILEPISMGNLACQRMTNQMGEAPFDKIKFKDILTGGKIIYMTKPQEKKKFKSETTKDSEAGELLNIQRCALASVGLSTNVDQVNTPAIKAFSMNSATNLTNTEKRVIYTNPENPDQSAIGANCFQLYMDEGRKTYYDSFMSDITQIEGFTRSLVQVITNIVNVGAQMDKKPTGCS